MSEALGQFKEREVVAARHIQLCEAHQVDVPRHVEKSALAITASLMGLAFCESHLRKWRASNFIKGWGVGSSGRRSAFIRELSLRTQYLALTEGGGGRGCVCERDWRTRCTRPLLHKLNTHRTPSTHTHTHTTPFIAPPSPSPCTLADLNELSLAARQNAGRAGSDKAKKEEGT